MKTILIVDDDREIASLAGLYLQNEGYHVVMRHDGEEALKAAQEDGIDLMVLDIMMPGVDGLEVCRKLRERNNTIPIRRDMHHVGGIGGAYWHNPSASAGHAA